MRPTPRNTILKNIQNYKSLWSRCLRYPQPIRPTTHNHMTKKANKHKLRRSRAHDYGLTRTNSTSISND